MEINHVEEIPPGEVDGHLCLYLMGVEEHIDLQFSPSLTLEELASSVGQLVESIILHSFTGGINADSRPASIQ